MHFVIWTSKSALHCANLPNSNAPTKNYKGTYKHSRSCRLVRQQTICALSYHVRALRANCVLQLGRAECAKNGQKQLAGRKL
jgi:hypothetical protein